MKFVSLFAGIGGLDLGFERAGHECVLQVERDPYCLRVLAKHWPDMRRIADVADVTVEDCEGADLMVGGFPCQPVSVAGKRLGADDERWLWPEFARLIRLVGPRHVVVENVPGLLAGAGMSEVLGDLAACGYDAEWDCIPAAAVGAPHLRYRVFIVAHPDSGRELQPGGRQPESGRWPQHSSSSVADTTGVQPRAGQQPTGDHEARHRSAWDVPDTRSDQLRDESGRGSRSSGEGPPVARDDGATQPMADASGGRQRTQQRDIHAGESDAAGRSADVADADSAGREERRGAVPMGPEQRPTERGGEALADAEGSRLPWSFASRAVEEQPRPPGTGWWAVEPDVGRVAHGVPRRVDRLRALGNAVVPQVAEYIGRLLPLEVSRPS